jgi:FkbM family methyltransferase
MKSFYYKILFKILRNIYSQAFWEQLFGLTLKRMNYGNGGDFEASGELNVFKLIKNKFTQEEKLIIFDVGANVGNYSKALANFFSSNVSIHSFEPSHMTYGFLMETVKGIQNIIPNNFGLSNMENDEVLYTNSEISGLASVYHRNLDHFGISMDIKETVNMSTIDKYCSDKQIDRIHFLKLDIEGDELKALQGAKEMIAAKKIEFIQFEFGGCNIDSRTFYQDFYYMLKDNYRLYRILKDEIVHLPGYQETYEIFITINFLAIKQ